MKISIYDHDIDCAARLATVLQTLGVEVYYCDALPDEKVRGSGLVIADPQPETTEAWLAKFRELYLLDTVVLVVSQNPDVLSGSLADSCYSMTKPIAYKEVLEIVKAEMFGGKVNFSGTRSGQ